MAKGIMTYTDESRARVSPATPTNQKGDPDDLGSMAKGVGYRYDDMEAGNCSQIGEQKGVVQNAGDGRVKNGNSKY